MERRQINKYQKKINTLRLFVAFITITVLFYAGCQPNFVVPVTDSNRPVLDTPQGLIDYLQRKKLPALRSVDIWENDFAPGLTLTTIHYQIHTTLMEPLVLYQIPGFVESAYKSYQSQLPEPIPTEEKFTVYLFATRSQWEDFTKTFTGPMAPVYLKIKKGAYYLNGACVAYNIGRERTFSVIGHEGWHQFNSRHFAYRLPSWLDEGIAMLFETSKYEAGWFGFEPGRNLGRLGALKKTLIEDKLIPLQQLIALNPGYVLVASDADAVMAFYAQSYALVRFLREENYGKRLGKYHQMLLDSLHGTWPLSTDERRIAADRNIPLTTRWNYLVATKLFKAYIMDSGENFGQLEAEYRAFCKKIVFRVRFKK